VREELPFPGILGRICPAYCESVCRRGQVDEPVAICALHRAAADHASADLVPGLSSGMRVAVVGAGPAGLAAAWFLVKSGHAVTIYDQEEKPGGVLRYYIPEFRLPINVLERELQPLWDAGVRFRGRSKIGSEMDPERLLDAGFDALIITNAGGSGASRPTLIGGEAALDGLDLMRRLRGGETVQLSGTVIVVGDGMGTVDVARTVARLGAAEVVVITAQKAEVMPSGSDGVEAALQENVRFEFDTTATEVVAVDGQVQGVKCGRDGAGILVAGATVILAHAERGGEEDHPSYPHVDAYTGRTSHEGVFVTADAAGRTPSTIHAVASGKRAALSVDAWLWGEDLPALEKVLAEHAALPYLDQLRSADRLSSLGRRLVERNPVWLHMGAKADPAPRVAMPQVEGAERLAGTTREVEQGYDMAKAQEEAKRCLQCVCPSLGTCDLQRLGVEYGITTNELIRPGGRVRVVQSQRDHPFIQRDMERCIACGRCVRVCRDVAGPACYEFVRRGFDMSIDTPYGDSLEFTDCISCGRCVTACPTGALTFNQRELTSFKVDESRCIMCGECVDVCPVDALTKTNHFEEARARWLELVDQGSRLAGGHRMCAGCGAPIVVRQILMGTSDPVVVSSATGCLEVSTTIYPYTSWKSSFIHTAFENSAATLSGVEVAFRALKKKGLIDENVHFVAFGGDGGTYDIGLQSLSGAMDRGHRMLYVCYDNGAYMNTGFQRSGATPMAAWTTTSPVGEDVAGKVQHRKNLTELMIAHNLEYVAQASPHDPRDLVRKAAKALSVDGPTFINVLSPCPRGWRADGAETIDLAREAVNTCYWPLFEYENGEYRLTYRPQRKLPLAPWLKRQGRFAHLFQPRFADALREVEAWVDKEWETLLCKCNEPSEEEWQAHLRARKG
jgi:pyruvate ferredoxin oxidoreductase beta subunit